MLPRAPARGEGRHEWPGACIACSTRPRRWRGERAPTPCHRSTAPAPHTPGRRGRRSTAVPAPARQRADRSDPAARSRTAAGQGHGPQRSRVAAVATLLLRPIRSSAPGAIGLVRRNENAIVISIAAVGRAWRGDGRRGLDWSCGDGPDRCDPHESFPWWMSWEIHGTRRQSASGDPWNNCPRYVTVWKRSEQ